MAEPAGPKKITSRELGQRAVAKGAPRGKPFGRYMLLKELGRGGMGVVYKAHDSMLGRMVALKMLLAGETREEDEQVQRFLREARSAAKLKHNNIVQLHDIGTVKGRHYFTMDYVEGMSLDDALELPRKRVPILRNPTMETTGGARQKTTLDRPIPRGPFTIREALVLVKTVAQALHYAHENRIIHRDIKPANILLNRNGNPMLTDFGLAKEFGGVAKSGLTVSGTILGTPKYMSPEQAGGRISELGPASDIYSIGALLYHLLTGRCPFEEESLAELLRDIMKKTPIPPSMQVQTSGMTTSTPSRRHLRDARGAPVEVEAALPREIDTICLKALEKKPSDRYRSAGELADDLDRFLAGETIQARASTTMLKARSRFAGSRASWEVRRRRARKNALIFGGLVGVIVVCAVIVLLVMRSSAHSHKLQRLHQDAQAALSEKNWNEVERLARLIQQEDPEDSRAGDCLARVSETRDELAQLREELERLEKEKRWKAVLRACDKVTELAPRTEWCTRHRVGAQGFLNEAKTLTQQAEGLMEGSKWQEAADRFRQAKGLAPHAFTADARLESCEQMLSRMDELLAQAKELLQEAEELMEARKWQEAADRFRQARDTAPHAFTTDAMLGRCEQVLARIDELLKQADELFEREDWIEAKSCYEEALALAPEHARARARMSACEEQLEAARLAAEAAAGETEDPEARERRRKAETYYSKARFRPAENRRSWLQAVEDLTQAIEIDLTFAEAYYERGQLHMRLGSDLEALEDLKSCIELGTAVTFARYFRGWILLLAFESTPQAKQEFQNVVEEEPDHEYARAAAAWVALLSRDFSRAERLCDEAEAASQSLYDVAFIRGYARMQQRDLRAAEDDFTSAIEVRPNFSMAYTQRAVARFHRKRYDAAEEDCEKVFEFNPHEPRALELMGLILMQRDQAFERALEKLELADEHAPNPLLSVYLNRGQAHYYIASTAEGAGNKRKAREHYPKAIEDFETFLKSAPTHSRATWVQEMINKARSRLEVLR